MRFLLKPISVHTSVRCTADGNNATKQNSSFPKTEDSSGSSYAEIQGGLFLLLPSGNLKTETECSINHATYTMQ